MASLEHEHCSQERYHFNFEVLLPSGETLPPMKKKKKSRELLFPINCRITDDERELLSRRVYDAGRRSTVGKIIRQYLFPSDWRSELDERREKHRRLGIKDTKFYSNRVLKRLGLKPKMGRPRKIKLPRAA